MPSDEAPRKTAFENLKKNGCRPSNLAKSRIADRGERPERKAPRPPKFRFR